MDAYMTWLDKYETSKNIFEKLESDTLELDQVVKGLAIELQHATTKKKDLQFKLEQIQAKHTDYQIYLTDLKDRQKTHDLHSQQLQFNWYSSLIEYREYVDQYLHFLKTHQSHLTFECKLFNEMLDNCIQKDKMVIEAEEMSQVIEHYPFWVEWKVETEKENVLGLKVTELETKIENGSCDDSSEFDLAELQRDRDAVEYLSNAFADYREWLFKTQIGPTICSKVNRILQMVCDERPLYLESEWLDKIDTLSWFVRDGDSRSIIEKASGFQRFIIGIGARVAFHQMGFCRTQYSQLFIDEGFTSCDTDNLEKVPDFLSSLMQFYGSIYLVTHLEDLKVCSDTHIHISREEGLSQIRYGSEEELVENPVNDVKKKGGRPLKKSVIVTKV
jgi:DNA repair exonuclease SbcCD ATPase subunit